MRESLPMCVLKRNAFGSGKAVTGLMLRQGKPWQGVILVGRLVLVAFLLVGLLVLQDPVHPLLYSGGL